MQQHCCPLVLYLVDSDLCSSLLSLLWDWDFMFENYLRRPRHQMSSWLLHSHCRSHKIFPHVDAYLNNCYLIWPNCRLAVRQAAVIIKKFASSIAPHITTILVHGKQVTFRRRWNEDSACLLPASLLASCLVWELCEVQPTCFVIPHNQVVDKAF